MLIPQAIVQSSAAGNFTSLYDSILGADAASFDVSGISQSYKHLMVLLSARGTNASAQENLLARVNNDSGANYDWALLTINRTVTGLGGTDGDTSMQVGFIPAASATAGKSASLLLTINDYASTTFTKNIITDTSSALANLYRVTGAATWKSTSAVNRLTFYPGAGNFLAGSRLTIYGLS